MACIVFGTVSSAVGTSSSHGLSVGVADSNLGRWDLSRLGVSSLGLGVRSEPGTTRFRAEPGSRFGPYLLIEQVGRGRQADVWRALRFEPKIEEVALKILSDPDRDPRRVAQLRREAERGRRLASPALLTSYEFGIAEGLPFMAMPLVVGCTLAQALDQRRAERAGCRSNGWHRLARLPEPRYTQDVVGILVRVARAVADAHASQVVHRDIKPGNILLHSEHESGVFLCDFGLGRDLDVATPGQLMDGAGSPSYMAPERLLKRHADEVRCDVYALGVTLYESLTLALPFELPAQLRREDWPAYLSTAKPISPSERRPTPPALEAVILRAIARDPERRYDSASDFADDLEASSVAA
jgi:serine/threonine protein kinase